MVKEPLSAMTRIFSWLISMRPQRLVCEPMFYAAMLAALSPFLVTAGWATVTSRSHVISQLGQVFKPAELTIRRGETVQILNDDGDLLHHVYLESDQFKFDSG